MKSQHIIFQTTNGIKLPFTSGNFTFKDLKVETDIEYESCHLYIRLTYSDKTAEGIAYYFNQNKVIDDHYKFPLYKIKDNCTDATIYMLDKVPANFIRIDVEYEI